MKGLIWIPIVILYILFFLFAVGLLLCSFYARYSKRRSSVNIDQSTLNKANRVDMENGHMRTESVQAMKTKFQVVSEYQPAGVSRRMNPPGALFFYPSRRN